MTEKMRQIIDFGVVAYLVEPGVYFVRYLRLGRQVKVHYIDEQGRIISRQLKFNLG